MTAVFHFHLISDATGETLSAIVRACLAQFDGVEVVEHVWSLVRTPGQVDRIGQAIAEHGGVVLCTVVDPVIYARLRVICEESRTPCISVLEPTLGALSAFFQQPTRDRPGGQHALSAEYFRRIEAIDFTIRHDDGQGLPSLHQADIVLVGVSRTSKTPTCLYLANRGYRVANVPIVDAAHPPAELIALDGPMVIALTTSPNRLVEIRRSRLNHISDGGAVRVDDYADMESVRDEVAAARRLFNRMGWPVVDVSRRSIEETAAAVIGKWSESGRPIRG